MGDNGCCVDVGFAAHNENFLKRAPDISVVRDGLVIRGWTNSHRVRHVLRKRSNQRRNVNLLTSVFIEMS
jgi:hypothetical protein